MQAKEPDLPLKLDLIKDLRVHESGYIIVQEEILKLLVENASDSVLLAAQRILKGQLPTPNQLNSSSPTIHWEIKLLRKTHKISQAKLAEEAEMEQPDISEFERNGSSSFGNDRKGRIVSALKTLIEKTE